MRLSKFFYPLLFCVFIGLILELIGRVGFLPDYVLPSTTQIVFALIENRRALALAFTETLCSSFFGFTLATLVGFSAGVALDLLPRLRMAVMPFAVLFQTVPIIAIAPLLVIWFGFGFKTVVISAFIVSVFPVLASAVVGLNSLSPEKLELFRMYNSSRTKTLLYLKIPSSWSHIITGLRISSGLSVIGAIVGEFIAGSGLGALIDSARTQQRVDLVFAAVVLSSILGIVFISCIQIISDRLLKKYLSNF